MTRALLALLLLAAGCTPAANTVPSGAPSSAGTLPDQLTFSADSGRAAEATVTFRDGGTVSAAAADGSTFELVVPPLAVAGDTLIRMTPLTDVQGLGDGAVHAVQLEPEGLLFFEFARLTITPASPIPVADQLMVEATGAGRDPGPALVDPTSEPIVILLEHFTIEVVAKVTPELRALMLKKSAGNAKEGLRRQLAGLIQPARVAVLLGEPSDFDLGSAVEGLSKEYKREVLEKLKAAAALSCTAVVTYVASVVSWERARQLVGLGLSEDELAASNARIVEAVGAMTPRYQACEKEAIAQCQAAKDPSILVKFWRAMEQPKTRAMEERAKQICELQGYQFEFSGSGTGTWLGATVPVVWHYWGLLCEGSEEWKIWEDLLSYHGRFNTRPPGDGTSAPNSATFDENGSITRISTPVYGVHPDNKTFGGTTLVLSPGDSPTTVNAVMPAGDEPIHVSAPVEPADGTIESCD